MNLSASQQGPKPGGLKEMAALAFPVVVASASDTVMIFTDRLFMSRLSPVMMNAAMAGGLSVYMMMTFFLGLTGYVTALAAQYFGAGHKEKCAVVTAQALLVSLFAFPLVILARPLAHFFFKWMGVASEQIEPQIEYFDTLLFIAGIAFVRNCLNSFFSGIGRTRIVMISCIVSMASNIGFNYVLIFGKFGFPALGIRGAALGSILAGFCGLLVVAFAYFRPMLVREFRILQSFRYDPEVMKKFLIFGYPVGLEMFLNILGFDAMVHAFHALGAVTATAATVVLNWDLVSYVPLIGVETGVTSLVGRYMGAGRPDLARKATNSGILFGMCYSVIVFIGFVGFPNELVAVFNPSTPSAVFSEAAPRAVFMLRLASLYVLLEAVMICYIGALRGAGDTFWAMVLTVVFHWILVAVLQVMFQVFHLPAETGWMTLIAVFFVFVGLIYLRYRSGRWQRLHLVD